MRDAIDQYTADKKIPPQTLEDLVIAGYFRSVPIDPITGSNSTWVVRVDSTPLSANPQDVGIVDVNSGSIDIATDGVTPYNLW
jgi:general secretion pathway protein G